MQAGKAKGVENLIQVENPNRVQKKTKKLSQLNQSIDTARPELSRRERYVFIALWLVSSHLIAIIQIKISVRLLKIRLLN